MKTKTHFAFRVDIWDDTGDSIVEHVAGADDFLVAAAVYPASIESLHGSMIISLPFGPGRNEFGPAVVRVRTAKSAVAGDHLLHAHLAVCNCNERHTARLRYSASVAAVGSASPLVTRDDARIDYRRLLFHGRITRANRSI